MLLDAVLLIQIINHMKTSISYFNNKELHICLHCSIVTIVPFLNGCFYESFMKQFPFTLHCYISCVLHAHIYFLHNLTRTSIISNVSTFHQKILPPMRLLGLVRAAQT